MYMCCVRERFIDISCLLFILLIVDSYINLLGVNVWKFVHRFVSTEEVVGEYLNCVQQKI